MKKKKPSVKKVDPIKKIVNMNKRRVTYLKENSRVILPKALKPSEEAKLQVRVDGYTETMTK